MKNRDWAEWWKRAGIRATKTIAEAALALIPAAATISEVDWAVVIGTAALAGIASLLTSIKGLPELNESEVK